MIERNTLHILSENSNLAPRLKLYIVNINRGANREVLLSYILIFSLSTVRPTQFPFAISLDTILMFIKIEFYHFIILLEIELHYSSKLVILQNDTFY